MIVKQRPWRTDERMCRLLAAGAMNCDSVVNVLDIAGFVQTLLDPAGYAARAANYSILNSDFDGDGSVTEINLQDFVTALLAY